jgi:putative RecB family exonuclease
VSARAYSHTSLSAFKNCPQRFKLQYIDKIRSEDEFIESFLGKRVHETLEKLYRDVQHGRLPDQAELLKFYDSEWDRNWSDKVRVVRKDYTAEDAREVGRRCLADYYKRYHPFRGSRVLAIEKMVQIEIPDGDKIYRVKGFIDRVDEKEDGHYEIHDYKTSQSLPEQAKMDEDRQLALYQIGLPALWPDVKKVDLVWHYLVFDKELRSTRQPEDLARLRDEIRAEIQAIEREKLFAPNVSALCDWCGFREVCPAWKHEVKVAALPETEAPRERGVNLVERFAGLERKRAELKAELKRVEEDLGNLEADVIAYARKEDMTRLTGKEGQVEIRKKEDVELPAKSENPEEWDKLIQLLRESKHWTEVAEVSRTQLKKAIEEGRWDNKFMEALSRFVRRTVKWTVKFRSRRDEDDDE